MKLLKLSFLFFLLIYLYNCTEKTIYSGKIINNDNFNYSNISNKNQLINELGNANYIDPIENKYYYFTEKRKYKNLFEEKIEKRIVLVFKFNEDNTIADIQEFNYNDENEIEFSKEKIENNLVKRGLIEKLFGGVSKSQLPNTSD